MENSNNNTIEKVSIEIDAETALSTIFYRRLLDILNIRVAKTFEKSASLKLIKTSSNNAIRYLYSAYVNDTDVSFDVLTYLLNKGYIKQSLTRGQYSITFLGVWEVEKSYDIVSESKLVDYFDKSFNTKLNSTPFDDDEKIIVFSLICTGAISESTPLSRKDLESQERSADAINDCAIFLLEKMHAISKIPKSNGVSSSSEEEWSQVFRRVTKLPPKSQMLYQGKDNIYYLKLYNHSTDEFDRDSLSFLFWKLFGDKLQTSDENMIVEFCQSIQLQYTTSLFKKEMLPLIQKYDTIYARDIQKSLFNIQKLSQKWV